MKKQDYNEQKRKNKNPKQNKFFLGRSKIFQEQLQTTEP